jgi:predicted DCC family thiol-disulfide oxidoreductase YuxK
MKRLYVLYDAQCELCRRCRNWLMKQAAFVPLVFIPFQSDDAQRRFPGIDGLKPGEQLLVISDAGAIYRGACAWIMCLWALQEYREHALRMASPVLLPFAKIVYELLSRNRFYLSDALFRQEPQTAARLIAEHYPKHLPGRARLCRANAIGGDGSAERRPANAPLTGCSMS